MLKRQRRVRLSPDAGDVLKMYNVSRHDQGEVAEMWASIGRKYHNYDHLDTMLQLITADENRPAHLTHLLMLAAVYHDIVYDPLAKDNEKRSVEVMRRHLEPLIGKEPGRVRGNQHVMGTYQIGQEAIEHIADLIMATADHNTVYEDALTNFFVWCDLYPLRLKGADLVYYEQQVFEEYQFAPVPMYIQERCKFLKSMLVNPHLKHADFEGIEWLIDYVRTRTYNIGVYAGSFDPFHVGHMDILLQAEQIFDKVVIVKAVNPEKDRSNSGGKLAQYLSDHEVELYDGMLPTYLKEYGKGLENVNVTLIRGLRDGNDLQYEQTQQRYMEDMSYGKRIQTVMLLCDKKYSHVSSSGIRNLIKMGAYDDARRYIRYDYI